MFLLFVVMEVTRAAINRLYGGAAPSVTALSFAVMLGTLVINLLVVKYEGGEAGG